MKKEHVLLKIPVTGEITLVDVCEKECKKLRSLLYVLEERFNTKMSDHPDIRKNILDMANFIRRLPYEISEIVRMHSDDP